LEVMQEFGVKHIVFSSKSATYGEPKALPITEETPTNPKNPYGERKLMMEKIRTWCDYGFDMNLVALRYFNVAAAKYE
ncbi:NAD-dependent epimerase/dehydratase family protein, partial [Enterococcus faecalis]|uniref:NAD-dependent epimerase/dehydratase family protein n=1 Tax=Enterococcus faecalis TaxID=1351 RepID=UPI003CC53A10